MKRKTLFLILIFLQIVNLVFGQELSEWQLRYRVKGLYEFFTIGDREYPFLTFFTHEEIVGLLSDCKESGPSLFKYQNDLKLANIFILSSYILAGIGGGAFIASLLPENQMPELFETAGIISLAGGAVLDGIGACFLIGAKGHIMDAVWEYNQK